MRKKTQFCTLDDCVVWCYMLCWKNWCCKSIASIVCEFDGCVRVKILWNFNNFNLGQRSYTEEFLKCVCVCVGVLCAYWTCNVSSISRFNELIIDLMVNEERNRSKMIYWRRLNQKIKSFWCYIIFIGKSSSSQSFISHSCHRSRNAAQYAHTHTHTKSHLNTAL